MTHTFVYKLCAQQNNVLLCSDERRVWYVWFLALTFTESLPQNSSRRTLLTTLTPRATGWIARTSSPAARFSRTGRKILDSKSAANDASWLDTGSSGSIGTQ